MTRRKRTLDELPGLAERGGYVYALLLANGIVRVGRTEDAREAVTAVRKDARSFGTDLADWWVSVPHAEWLATERALIESCHVLGGRRTGPGSFSGVDFGLLTGKASDLPFTSTAAYAYGRRHRRRKDYDDPYKRMAVSARYRAEGLSLRAIAARQSVSQTTIARDLARWDLVGASMPLEIIRLSRPAVTPSRNTGSAGAGSIPAGDGAPETAVTSPRYTGPGVIPFRRPA